MLTHRSTTGTDSELPRSESLSSTEKHAHDDSLQGDKEKDKIDVESLVVDDEDVDETVIKKDEDVAVEVRS